MIIEAFVCAAVTLCSAEPVRVLDGDTIVINQERIRLSGIDAPELKGECAAEKQLANKARQRLIQLINGSAIQIKREGKDRYGRTLAAVTSQGTDLGEILIKEGLARRWVKKADYRGKPWCKTQAGYNSKADTGYQKPTISVQSQIAGALLAIAAERIQK